MRTRYIISDDGKCIGSFAGSEEMLELNTQGKKYTEVKPASPSDWWSFKEECWKSIGDKPSTNHQFDYAEKEWVDPRPLEEIKEEKWNQIKIQRNRLEFGGFEFEGKIFDSDIASQSRIATAASLGFEVEWTTKDNSTVLLSSDQLKSLQIALARHVNELHEKARKARAAISEAQNKEEVEAVTLI
ncbi:DUF4376 domain-containing protein [Acinetobacter baumannii]